MSRFYVPKESVKGNKIFVYGKEAHHILDVMRLKKSDSVVTFDGTGKEYVGVIKEVGRDSLVVEVAETRESNSGLKIAVTLIQAIPKKEKMDYIVEKATELGVSAVIPVIAGRTIVNWDEKKKEAHAQRWCKISREASKQCGRSDIPDVSSVKDLKSAVKDTENHDLKLIAALSDGAISLKDALKDFEGKRITIAIGPEGDFTPDEIKLAKSLGFKVVNLGQRVLKSDTAGLAMLAVLNYEFSN